MSTSEFEAAVRELLDEGLDDWVPLDQVIWASRNLAEAAGTSLQKAASDLVSHLIENNLMVSGVIGSEGFEHWSGSPSELVHRVIRDCERYNWEPFGAGCWMANTEHGDRVAQRG